MSRLATCEMIFHHANKELGFTCGTSSRRPLTTRSHTRSTSITMTLQDNICAPQVVHGVHVKDRVPTLQHHTKEEPEKHVRVFPTKKHTAFHVCGRTTSIKLQFEGKVFWFNTFLTIGKRAYFRIRISMVIGANITTNLQLTEFFWSFWICHRCTHPKCQLLIEVAIINSPVPSHVDSVPDKMKRWTWAQDAQHGEMDGKYDETVLIMQWITRAALLLVRQSRFCFDLDMYPILPHRHMSPLHASGLKLRTSNSMYSLSSPHR